MPDTTKEKINLEQKGKRLTFCVDKEIHKKMYAERGESLC